MPCREGTFLTACPGQRSSRLSGEAKGLLQRGSPCLLPLHDHRRATFCWWMLLPCVSIRGRGCGACAMFILATLVRHCGGGGSAGTGTSSLPSPLRQMIVIPLAIVAALVIARVDGVHYAPVAAILTPFWLIDAGVLIGGSHREGRRQQVQGSASPQD